MKVLESFSLAGKISLVTGCKRGIGKAMAITLADAGANIVGVSATLETRNSDVGNKIETMDREFHSYQCDLGQRDSLLAFIDKLSSNHPNIDILVNNVGTIMRAPAVEHPDDYWDHVIEVNLNSQFILSREVGKGMIQRGSGKIIFTASLLTFQGGITVPGYAASKEGIGQLVKALANEWAGQGINIKESLIYSRIFETIQPVVTLRSRIPHEAAKLCLDELPSQKKTNTS